MATVLVIDDDEGILGLAKAHLQKAGFSVETFDSVDGGLERLRAGPEVAAVLLDGILPGRDGWDFLQALGTDPTMPSPPIVLMSDLVDLTQSRLPGNVTIKGRLQKPFTGESLTKAIQDAVG